MISVGLKRNYSMLILVILALLTLLITGCGTTGQETSGEEKQSSGNGVLTMGTMPVGSAYHSAGSGISKVASDHSSLKVTVSPYSSSLSWTPALNKGEIELGLKSKPGTHWGFHGEYNYQEEYKNMHLVAKGNNIVLAGLTVQEDSHIESLKDLKGKRITTGFSGDPLISLITEAQLASVGLTLDDVTEVPVADVGEGVTALREGRVDATFVGIPTVAQFLELDNAIGLKSFNYGDISPDELNSLSEDEIKEIETDINVPGIELIAYKGGYIEEERVLVQNPTSLVASSHMSEDAAYEFTKALYENYEELHPLFAWLETWTPETMFDEDPLVPYHPGVVRYLEEEGLWNEELDQKQRELLEKAKE